MKLRFLGSARSPRKSQAEPDGKLFHRGGPFNRPGQRMLAFLTARYSSLSVASSLG